MEYENFLYKEKEDINLLLATGNQDIIISAIIGAINGIDDWQWLQDMCLKYVMHSDIWISKTAINGLGDIARIHKKLEKGRVLDQLSLIKDEKLIGVVHSTVDDINIFLK